jgi:hypothetical protein
MKTINYVSNNSKKKSIKKTNRLPDSRKSSPKFLSKNAKNAKKTNKLPTE